MTQRYDLDDLLYLMARLRDPDGGCPWDLVQTYKTIAASTIEEAYEVVDAIETEDFKQLREELGDFLFQVIFYSQLAREEGRFDFHDIIHSVTDKLIRRHPHVFPNGELQARFEGERTESDELAIKAQWEVLKQQEREDKGFSGVLADVPIAMPALPRAAKLQKRAARVGFDWPDIEPVFAKISEELDEVKEALQQGDQAAVNEELGDLLFSVVNLARHLKSDPETSLRQANAKFERRFEYIEACLRRDNLAFEQVSLERLDQLWDQTKQAVNLS
ncbi:MAG: nucleoside triphosphate pyrophosphohydrolase [Candidatus Pelagadaptatus aseana]|uniref:nucleoside triphosphate pyrophosphohydrolase n=1 Tax=Candidatus Pelagadaptatus aseana TaxID=3120508 RepID=UPI0039B2837B